MATKQDLKDLENRVVMKIAAVVATMLTLAIGIITVLVKFL